MLFSNASVVSMKFNTFIMQLFKLNIAIAYVASFFLARNLAMGDKITNNSMYVLNYYCLSDRISFRLIQIALYTVCISVYIYVCV